MKNFFLTFGLTILTLFSCSKSEDSSTNSSLPIDNSSVSNVILPKKMIISDVRNGSGQTTTTYNYTYNGTKLVQSVDQSGNKTIYTYTNDLITKIETYIGVNIDNLETFTYNSNGKLTQYTFKYTGAISRQYNYVYNTDGTVTQTEYNYSGTTLYSTRTLTFTGGELTKIQDGSWVRNLEYDTKNFPFKNVTGMQEIKSLPYADDFLTNLGRNKNVIKAFDNSTPNPQTVNASYSYNSDNYPTSCNFVGVFSSNANSGSATVQYFY